MRHFENYSLVALFAIAVTTTACAQENTATYASGGDESNNFQSEVVLQNLNNPAGIVVRNGPVGTGPHELFIAESGAGRIVKVSTDNLENINDVISGFSIGNYSLEPNIQIGPLSLNFLTRSKLVVGEGGRPDGKNLASVYSLPIDGSPITADNVDHSLDPQSDKQSQNQYFAIAKTEVSLFLAADEIFKSSIDANKLTDLQPFISPQKIDEQGPATSITHTPKSRPSFLVVGHMGSKKKAHDSWISFFVPSTGVMALSLGTGLHDIAALAYSPSGNLYALDIAWQDESLGGIYRLDDARVDGRQACRAVKIASIVRPTALAFTPDGKLYVTAFGSGEDNQQGTLVKIIGNF